MSLLVIWIPTVVAVAIGRWWAVAIPVLAQLGIGVVEAVVAPTSCGDSSCLELGVAGAIFTGAIAAVAIALRKGIASLARRDAHA